MRLKSNQLDARPSCSPFTMYRDCGQLEGRKRQSLADWAVQVNAELRKTSANNQDFATG